MSKELTHLEKHTKELNSPPKDTFRRHMPAHWRKDEPLPEDKQRENELYDAWLQSLKPGDAVYYNWRSEWSSGRDFTTVKSKTKTGMIRLEDGKLIEQNGRVKGEFHRYLQPYTEEYRVHDQRKNILHKLSTLKLDHLTNDGLTIVMEAIMRAEGMLPQALKEAE